MQGEKNMPQPEQFQSQPAYPTYYEGNYPPTAQSYPPGQPPSYQPAETYQPPTVQAPQPQQMGWFARNRMNKPQSNAVGAGMMIFLSGGMSLAVTIQTWSLSTFFFTTHIRISWPAGVLIGIVCTMAIYNIVPKKLIVQLASLIVIISGIISVSTNNNYEAFLAARYLNGIATGLAFAPTVVFVGELTVKGMRGMNSAAIEALAFSLGFLIHVLYSTLWTDGATGNFTVYQLDGVLYIVYGIMAVIFATFLSVESPVSLLAKNQEQEAIEVLRKLQAPYIVTTETYSILQEHKNYLALNRDMNNSVMAGMPALLRLIIYRVLNTMAISMVASLALTFSIIRLLVQTTHDNSITVIICYGVMRFLGTFVAVFLMDNAGRKNVTLFGFLVGGGLAIGVGVSLNQMTLANFGDPYTSVVLILCYQFFASMASTASSPYLSEAFPLAVKPYFISLAFFIEILVLLIICIVDPSFSGLVDYFYVLGSFSLVFFLAGIWCLPETKWLPLSEAQQRFEACMDRGFN